MTEDLRQRIADAIERDALKPAAEREGIIPAVLDALKPELDELHENAGVIKVLRRQRDTAEQERNETRAALEQLRTRTEKAERAVDLLAGSHRRAEQAEVENARLRAEAAVGRVRAVHQRNKAADYCDVCSKHGDITWPCATIRALAAAAPTPVAESAPCAECGHPKDQHSEAAELVSVGQCQQCVADGNEGDAWHNYEPQEQQ
ncbi:hypothetical protein [Streptomyces lydicus]|uniref:hypothetical protein n=1 Tax=Streptomyces lydicus TaxID=47763 RepID=UPI003819F34D